MRMRSICNDQVLAYIAGELTGTDLERAAWHVTRCAKCSATAQRFRAVGAILRSDDSFLPPSCLIVRVRDMFSCWQQIQPAADLS